LNEYRFISIKMSIGKQLIVNRHKNIRDASKENKK